jgi:chemotaxis protein histidine kinase CheA/DNA-binding NarL/FixJ family response regulator
MLLSDLLQVLREEFAQAANDIDASLMAWLGEGPAAAERQAGTIAGMVDRLAMTSRLVAMEGAAVALEQLRDTAQTLALLDEDSMGQGLGWLVGWRGAFEPVFAQPGAAEPADALLAWLAQGPMAPPDAVQAELRSLLVTPPALPPESAELAATPSVATDDDVSLALPDDLQHDLYETFLADAPGQLAQLSEAVRQLVRDGLSGGALAEAQRVAHTFKGSGNIIGVAGIGRLAHRIEDLIEFAGRHSGTLPAAMGHDLEQATATLDQMIYALRGEEEPPTHAREHLQRLLDWVRAIEDGSWSDGLPDTPPPAMVGAEAPVAADDPSAAPDGSAARAAPTATNLPAAPPDGDAAETQLRVGVGRLDRLLRGAAQSLVRGSQIGEQWRRFDERMAGMAALNIQLAGRLAELQLALERQGVTLQEKASNEGDAFDPLEMDRYNHVQTLSRFVAELVSDEAELVRGARDELLGGTLALREQQQALKEQHHELLGARLVPFRQIVSRLKRTVSQTAAALQRRVRLEVQGEAAMLDSEVLERLTEPLLHLLRNAVDHGIEPAEERLLLGKPEEGVIRLQVRRDGQTVQLRCSDDGRGIDLASVLAKASQLGLLAADAEPPADEVMRLILLPGFSTRNTVTEVSGRGVGLDVVAERVRAMKGRVDIDSQPLEGTTLTLRLPATGSALHALVVQAGGEQIALPTEGVIAALAPGQGRWHEGRFEHGQQRHAGVNLAHWLGLPDSGADPAQRPVVLVRGRGETLALSVDSVLDARELILQELGTLLAALPGLAGGALRSDGRVLFVLDLEPLQSRARRSLAPAAVQALAQRAQLRRQRVLVVDDAISVRKALGQLLQDAGYEVLTARDGFEALQTLERETVQAVLTDLEMPQLNGLELTQQLRRREQAAGAAPLPVVMITSRSTDKHRQAAQQAGVTQYLTKPYTDAALLQHLRGLLQPRDSGEAASPADHNRRHAQTDAAGLDTVAWPETD